MKDFLENRYNKKTERSYQINKKLEHQGAP